MLRGTWPWQSSVPQWSCMASETRTNATRDGTKSASMRRSTDAISDVHPPSHASATHAYAAFGVRDPVELMSVAPRRRWRRFDGRVIDEVDVTGRFWACRIEMTRGAGPLA